jgi:hypothetical protein
VGPGIISVVLGGITNEHSFRNAGAHVSGLPQPALSLEGKPVGSTMTETIAYVTSLGSDGTHIILPESNDSEERKRMRYITVKLVD